MRPAPETTLGPPRDGPRTAVDPASQVAQHTADAVAAVYRLLARDEAAPGDGQPLSVALIEVPAFVSALASGNTPRAAAAGLSLVGRYLRSERFALPTAVVRAISFGADLIAAGDPEQAAAVIDQFAAPLGGWRGKSHRPMASITAMVGFTGGYVHPIEPSDTNLSGGGSMAALGAVGLDLSLPFAPTSSRHWGSFGLFIPVLDVGALLSYSDLSRTDASGLQSTRSEFNPLQFVAPGLYLRVGVPVLPLVIGGGVTYAPASSTLVERDMMGREQTFDVPAIRAQLFLAVDVTILPL